MKRAALIALLAASTLWPTASATAAGPYRRCSIYVNFGHVTGARGVSCASAGLIASAFANLVVAGDRPPKHLARYACTTRDPDPNSEDGHLAVTCTRGPGVAIRFTVGP